MYESGRFCIRFWFIWSMNALQNTHSHKAISVSWYTNVTCVRGIYPVAHSTEGKYFVLEERIIKMNTSRVSGIYPCNQDNKERKERKNQDRDRVGKVWVKPNDTVGPSYFTAPGKIHFATLAHSQSSMCSPSGRHRIMCWRNIPCNSAALSTVQLGPAGWRNK